MKTACCVGLVLLLAGCDLFKTRDPEAPTQSISTFETPTSHDIVLRNFSYAISENNVRNYIRCFVDTLYRPYQFEPSPEEAPKFVVWTLESEQRYFQNIGVSLTGPSSLTDSVTLVNLSPGPPATAVYFLNYTLYVPHQDPRAPKLFRGSMELDLTEDSLHLWSIYRWADKKTGPDSTWSYLKAWFNR